MRKPAAGVLAAAAATGGLVVMSSAEQGRRADARAGLRAAGLTMKDYSEAINRASG